MKRYVAWTKNMSIGQGSWEMWHKKEGAGQNRLPTCAKWGSGLRQLYDGQKNEQGAAEPTKVDAQLLAEAIAEMRA